MTFDPFWWKLRLYWMVYVVVFSTVIGLGLSFVVTLVSWSISGSFSLELTQLKALYTVALFWFKLAWALSFLLALVFSFRKIFNREIAGKTLFLMDCESKEPLIPVILLDILPLWRKFLFMMVWVLVVMALLLLGLFGIDKSFFGGSTLFILILLFGALLLPVMLLSVKNVRRSDNPRLKARK